MSEIRRGATVGGRYVLSELIATGGMGEVWKATDNRLHREVAVKVLRSELAVDEVARRRFKVEAQAAANLNSLEIASVYDYGEEPGNDHGRRPYIVMELVRGESLEERLRREGRLKVEETLDIVAQAASGLQVAHDHRLIHRDIKPANLLIRSDGVVKLTDFGIVKVLDSTTVTQNGLMVGTVRYMAPEQVSGSAATPASDIYSLGVVAYTCIAGHVPFENEASIAVAMAHVHEEVPPMPTDVPMEVVGLISHMLSKGPPDRPSTAREVAQRASDLRVELDQRTQVESTALNQIAKEPVDTAWNRSRWTSSLDSANSPTLPGGPKTEAMLASVVVDPTRKNARSHWQLVALLGSLVVVGIAVGIGLWINRAPERVVVPHLAGMTTGAATKQVDNLGLHAEQQLVDVNRRAGRVVSQKPGPGTSVKRGSRLVLDVSSGFVTADAAAIDGEPAASAVTTLSTLGLIPVQTMVISASTPGSVVAISPAGRIRVGSSVAVSVAVAPPPSTTTTTTTVPASSGGASHHKHGKRSDQ